MSSLYMATLDAMSTSLLTLLFLLIPSETKNVLAKKRNGLLKGR